jgi:hypothetical protein
MNAVKCISWSAVGTEAHTVEVSGRQTAIQYRNLHNTMDVCYNEYYKAVTSLKMFLYKILVAEILLPPECEK